MPSTTAVNLSLLLLRVVLGNAGPGGFVAVFDDDNGGAVHVADCLVQVGNWYAVFAGVAGDHAGGDSPSYHDCGAGDPVEGSVAVASVEGA